jgi:hypothetical protein
VVALLPRRPLMSALAEIEALTGVRPRPFDVAPRIITIRTCLSEEFAREMARSDAFGREVYIFNVFDVPAKEWTNPWGLEERDYIYKLRL